MKVPCLSRTKQLKKHSIISYLPVMTALHISRIRQADATSEKDNKEDDEDEDDPQLFGQAMQDVLDINTKNLM